MTVSVHILTLDPRWKGLRPTVERAVAATLVQRKIKLSAVTVVLSNDAEVRTLNREYRGKDKATNVLSFPNGEKLGGVMELGDIILAYETVCAEAQAQSKRLKDHLTHLVIHGTLHLLGFDHESDTDADIMEACEIRLLATMGIANPYETS